VTQFLLKKSVDILSEVTKVSFLSSDLLNDLQLSSSNWLAADDPEVTGLSIPDQFYKSRAPETNQLYVSVTQPLAIILVIFFPASSNKRRSITNHHDCIETRLNAAP
jgi:hypothetical protein